MVFVRSYSHVDQMTTVRRVRSLPRPGNVLVRAGQRVDAMDVVARAEVPREHHLIDLAKALKTTPDQVGEYILKKPDETIEQGEPLAERSGLMGLRRYRVLSPVEGRVVTIGDGQILVEGNPEIIEVRASVPGVVASVTPDRDVVVEVTGALIQIAWGTGGLAYGVLKVIEPDQSGRADPERFNIDHRGAIVAVSAPLDEHFLRAAVEARVRAIVGGSMHARLVPVAEKIGYPVGITQGFGDMPMSQAVTDLLRANNGRDATLDAATSEGWRVVRPEIIIPLPAPSTPPPLRVPGELLGAGARVRIVRAPHMGTIGQVKDLPARPRQLDSGLRARGAEVELPSGEVVFVPFANLEHLG
jgi:hypothetical protein